MAAMKDCKLQIYKGMIQYLLESTNYSLKNIADLSNSPVGSIRSIYCDEILPDTFKSERQLLRLYQLVLEIKMSPRESLAG